MTEPPTPHDPFCVRILAGMSLFSVALICGAIGANEVWPKTDLGNLFYAGSATAIAIGGLIGWAFYAHERTASKLSQDAKQQADKAVNYWQKKYVDLLQQDGPPDPAYWEAPGHGRETGPTSDG